jgi:ABC-2 type transport system ATP-binding protein
MPKEEEKMIHVEDLIKSYGEIEALRGVSFDIKAGEIVGLLGPNGAGKTTIIKTLTGYLQPGGGIVQIDDLDVLTHTREIQARIGYLPENAPLYPELSVQNYLKMMADLRQIPPPEQVECISDAVYATGLTEHLTRLIGQLSKGFRQRVGLAQAILHKPSLLILDEPTVGLDPTQVVKIRRLIRRLSRTSTILFSTHILSEVEALCDRAIILMYGQIRADSRLSELATTTDAILVLQQTVPDLEASLKELSGVRDLNQIQTRDGYPTYHIFGQEQVDLCPMIFDLARQKNWPVRELRRDTQTLETVFNRLATAV